MSSHDSKKERWGFSWLGAIVIAPFAAFMCLIMVFIMVYRWVRYGIMGGARRCFNVRVLLLPGLLAALSLGFTPANGELPADFRIVDIRAEHGQLVLEVQHFDGVGHGDDNHGYFEDYTWQGREWYARPRVTDQNGRLFISTGAEAPFQYIGEYKSYHLPAGETWLRYSEPHLALPDIYQTIAAIHVDRRATGWDRGQYRKIVTPLDYTAEDETGAVYLVNHFNSEVNQARRVAQDGTVSVYSGEPIPATEIPIGTEPGTIATFHPAEDGSPIYDASGGVGVSWDTIHDATSATSVNVSDPHWYAMIYTGSGTDKWWMMNRGGVTFDTSTLPPGDIITAATVEFIGKGFFVETIPDQSVSLVNFTPASSTNIVVGDWDQWGSTKQAADLTLAEWHSDVSTPNVFTLNATGLAYIEKTTYTDFGVRITSDAEDAEPSWLSQKQARVQIASKEETDPGDTRPKLTVTHVAPTAAITGTVGDGAAEQEVRDGSGTVIITLTDTEWVADGATFDAQRQNIIDGLDSAQSETNGWNNEVRDEIGVSSVVRTSATVATITLTASEVADYRITSDETITATVPATATSAGAITATPTFTITAATEGVALTGTMQAGVTSSPVIAGGQTFILTLTETTWVADGATFDAQRQNIINGITSNQADQNGWDNQKSNLPVTDVVRTSATVVTITLSALAGYAIPEPETLTTTAPASAINYGATLTAAATATVTPSFAASGTWVSPAIDLSSISDLTYCAIGWSATTPANTTVAGSYSVNGGSDYATATNGACPFAENSDQSSVTDFRVRLTLSAIASTDTPTVDSVGFVAGTAAGQTLRYQLNTTPGLTVTDRTGGGYAGTMSFPSLPSNVDTSVGSMEAIRETVSGQLRQGFSQVTVPVTGSAVSPNVFNLNETGWVGLPGYAVVNSMADAGDGLPVQFVWYIILGLIVIMLGFFALNLTQSILIAAVAMGVGLGVCSAIGGGLIPGWMVFVFLPIAGGLVLLRPRLAI